MKIPEKTQVFLLIVLCTLVLLAPGTIRTLQKNPLPYGAETAYASRILQQNQYDPVQERPTTFNLLFYGVSRISFMEQAMLLKLLPFVLGMLSMLMLFLLLRKERNYLFIIFLFIASPVFIYVFSSLNALSAIIFLNLLGFFIFLQKRGWLSCFVFAIIPFIDVLAFFLTAILLMSYAVYQKYKIRDVYIIIVVSLLPLMYMITQNTISIHQYFDLTGIHELFVEFGVLAGISLPLLILAIIGIAIKWPQQRLLFAAYLLLILFFIGAMYSTMITIYLGFLLPFFGGFALRYFLERKWSIQVLRNITLLLIFCSLLFSVISFVDQTTQEKPNPEMVHALTILKDFSDKQELVFSSPQNGFFIEKYAERKAFLDGKSYEYPDYTIKKETYETLIASRNFETTSALLEKNNIQYFYIDTQMKQQLWNNREDGLLFLLMRSRNFVRIYASADIEIYQYVKLSEQQNI
ncbi:hypothetical protein C4573_04355 [Candidatus Woesearchaeota archaeon]|nr:MAG: hypothetical protein C4573_04355 [Candidatus Woesearchaeota archaeon]